jgi:group I intron endonuclease
MKNNNNNNNNINNEFQPKNSDVKVVTPLTYPHTPVKVYDDAEKSKSDMLRDFKQRAIIYMFYNKVTGKVYVGSSADGHKRLNSYFQPSIIARKGSLIYLNIAKYGYKSFSVIILQDLGPSNTVTKDFIIAREQFYLDWALKTYGLGVLNVLKMADSSLGFRHTKESILKMSMLKKGEKNPMYGKPKSEAFIAQQTRDKTGANNPSSPGGSLSPRNVWGEDGVKKSEDTLAKLRKMVYVYNATDNYKLVGVYATVECFRKFNMGYDTLTKRLSDGKLHKGYLFSRGPYSPNS